MIRRLMTDVVLQRLSPELGALYAGAARPSIGPEYILRALLLQVFFSIRSERLLVEQIDYNLLFRSFVGLAWMMRCGTMLCFRRTAIVC
jgi:transposase